MKRRRNAICGESLETRRCLAPVAFVQETLIGESEVPGVHQTVAADIDNDGDVDLVSIGSEYILTRNPQSFSLAVSENVDGRGAFVSRTVVHADVAFSRIAVFDFDGDNDVDIIASQGDRFSGYQTYAYPNDGQGEFGEARFVGDFLLKGTADTNVDGELDLIGLERFGATYVSDGAGGFTSTSNFVVTRDTTDVVARDVDGDGDDDLLVVDDGGIYWSENLAGQLGRRTELIDTFRGAPSATYSDVDSDGDLDIIAAYNPDRNLVWFEFADGRYSSAKRITTFDRLPRGGPIRAFDVDDDGDNDIVLPIDGSRLGWLEYDSALGQFHERGELLGGKLEYSSVEIADINGDQIDDIVISSRASDTVSWYERTGVAEYVEHRAVHSQSRPHALHFADVDVDGDLDLFAAASGDFLLWTNDDGKLTSPTTLKLDVWLGYDIDTADIDGDGMLDVVVADFGGQVHWIRQLDGQGNFGDAQPVADQREGLESIALGDADGDGDVDVFTASRFDGTVAWYENDALGGFNERHLIVESAGHIQDVSLGDLDGDGDLDVLSVASNAPAFPGAPAVAWYENQTGNGDYGTAQVLTSFGQPGKIRAHDFDGDGDQDVIGVSRGIGSVYLYENTRAGLVSQGLVVDAPSEDLAIADLDGDGDSDLALVGRNTVTWLENLGELQFELRSPISSVVYDASAVAAADIDRDGRVDLVFASNDSSEIRQRRNAGIPGDANGDGVFDNQDLIQVFEANEYEDEIENNSTLMEGDFDGDGEFTTADLVFAMKHGRYQA